MCVDKRLNRRWLCMYNIQIWWMDVWIWHWHTRLPLHIATDIPFRVYWLETALRLWTFMGRLVATMRGVSNSSSAWIHRLMCHEDWPRPSKDWTSTRSTTWDPDATKLNFYISLIICKANLLSTLSLLVQPEVILWEGLVRYLSSWCEAVTSHLTTNLFGYSPSRNNNSDTLPQAYNNEAPHQIWHKRFGYLPLIQPSAPRFPGSAAAKDA